MAGYALPQQDITTLYSQWMRHHLHDISNDDLGRITRAEHTAFIYTDGQKRRNGDDAITHPLSMAVRAMDFGWPPTVIINIWLHDIFEDSDTQPEVIERFFGWKVATTVLALSRLPKGINSFEYFGRMTKETLKVREDGVILWMIPMVKLLDLADFCLRPYPLVQGKTVNDEIQKLDETFGPFSWMYRDCRAVIPSIYLDDCDALFTEIQEYVIPRLDKLRRRNWLLAA